jgi:hypothetical protein
MCVSRGGPKKFFPEIFPGGPDRIGSSKKFFPEIFPGGPDRIGSSKKFFPEIFPIVGKRRAKLPLRSKSVVFPKKSEYVPVQKNFPEIFYLPGKIRALRI